ncbi:MAG TPA: hypothetical protein VJI69_09025 [Bacteroidia bacterium]|nr:hypothetical protein [Bacteroidia bacterium]
MNLSNKKSILLLVLFLLGISLLLYHSSIFLPPSFIHAWTQSERYAISLQFLNNGFDVFHPATFNLQTVDGITRMDFPLNEFIVAILMKIFGTIAPVVFRIYMLCVSIIGLTFLYLLAKKITSSELKSWIVVAFVFLSPLYTYYQAGFIPCVSAISFIFIAYYFFYNYKMEGKKKQFYLAVFFFLLAGMIRMPFFIFLIALAFQQSYIALKQKKVALHELLGFVTSFSVIVIYYLHSVHIGLLYGNMFLDKFLPAKSFGEFVIIIKYIYQHWLFQYFSFWHYVLLFISIVCTIIAYRKSRERKNKVLWFNLLIVGAGGLLYFLLMSSQYVDHDYYFLDSLFIPIVLLFLLSIQNISIDKKSSKLVLFFIACICGMFMYGDSRRNQFERYAYNNLDRGEITRSNFEDAENFLDSNGIPKEAKMLVIDAYSTNIPLYMMNRKGYTVYQTNRDNAAIALFWARWDYVVIQDQFLFSDVLKYYPIVASIVEPFCGNGKITVYKRSKNLKKKSIEELLQLKKKLCLLNESFDFETSQAGHFSSTENIIYSESLNSNVAILDSLVEYGVSFQIGANELKSKSNLSVKTNFDFVGEDLSGIKIVLTIANEGKTINYQSYLLNDFYKAKKENQRGMFYFTLPKFYNANDIVSIYLWNPTKKSMLYDNFEIVIYKNQE